MCSLEWLYQSFSTGKFVDEKEFILEDNEIEAMCGLTTAEALKRAKNQPVFQGVKLYFVPDALSPEQLEQLVCISEHGGAKVLSKPPSTLSSSTYIITTSDTLQHDITASLIVCDIVVYIHARLKVIRCIAQK